MLQRSETEPRSSTTCQGRLAGVYVRTGSTLTRSGDGARLVLTATGATDARRSDLALVEVLPDRARRRVGFLYPAAPGADDLDGREFDDRIHRYRVTLASPGDGSGPVYHVATLRRKGEGRPSLRRGRVVR